MTTTRSFDSQLYTVAFRRDLSATLVPTRPGPPIRVDGLTIGVVTMTQSAPHGGEMHPDGDELLHLISGRARVTLETTPVETLEMKPGDGVIVPKGVWHRVEIIEPSQFVFVTPGPGGEHRPLRDTG